MLFVIWLKRTLQNLLSSFLSSGYQGFFLRKYNWLQWSKPLKPSSTYVKNVYLHYPIHLHGMSLK